MDERRQRPERAASDLLAKAEELRRMAETATTEETRDALLRVAAQYAALAARVAQTR